MGIGMAGIRVRMDVVEGVGRREIGIAIFGHDFAWEG